MRHEAYLSDVEKMKTGLLKNFAAAARSHHYDMAERFSEFEGVRMAERETYSEYMRRIGPELARELEENFHIRVIAMAGNDYSLTDLQRLEKANSTMLERTVSMKQAEGELPVHGEELNNQW